MTKLVVVNEILSDKDAQAFLRLAKLKVPDCELQWGKMFDSYEVQTFLDPKVPYVLKAGETPIFLTERKAVKGIAGKHEDATTGNNCQNAIFSVAYLGA